MKPLTQDPGYDNVLLMQGYRTPRGAVTDEHVAIVKCGKHWKTEELGKRPACFSSLHPSRISLEVNRD
jgi:hypothetical protein